jgi:hypothetical protein
MEPGFVPLPVVLTRCIHQNKAGDACAGKAPVSQHLKVLGHGCQPPYGLAKARQHEAEITALQLREKDAAQIVDGANPDISGLGLLKRDLDPGTLLRLTESTRFRTPARFDSNGTGCAASSDRTLPLSWDVPDQHMGVEGRPARLPSSHTGTEFDD